MEIEEMQKIWNEQKGETMYAIDEDALHRSINRKKNAASHRMDHAEIGVSIINGAVAVLLFVDALDDTHHWDFVGSGMLVVTVLFIQYFRHRRKKGENRFDRSVMGELDHAISNTNYIIRFSYLMVAGYLVPFNLFYIGKMFDRGASLEKWLMILSMYALAFFLIRWERRNCHIPRKEQLEKLKEKLQED